MKIQRAFYNLFVLALFAALVFGGWQPALAQSAQPVVATGRFSIIWGDARSGTAGTAVYLLTDDQGQVTRLSMDEKLAVPAGGILALDRQRVKISGVRSLAESSDTAFQVDAITLENPQEGASTDVGINTAVTGSHPFISILCKFHDVTATPKTLSYFQNMYGPVYPGLDDYWQQESYLMANISGSTAVGWYTLPHDRAYYLPGGHLDFNAAASDCTAAADADVDFTPYQGINLMFNDELDGFAWGGTQYMTLDGSSRTWGMTWEPPWGYASITVVTHEMGHAFGLPHSSGQYGQTYDNQWDVMSDGWTNCALSTDATYGCLGQETISYHRDKLGWIPAAQKYTAGWGTNVTLTMEQLDMPQTNHYLMVQIPIGGSTTHFYTVEVRRQLGYDVKVPANAVVIHDVDIYRLNPANVIDIDGNGNTGDAGAQWLPGERFSDAANGIYVKVVSATATGFVVSIQTPAIFKATAAGDGWVLESGENTNLGGTLNAGATTLRLGDDGANKQYRSIVPFDTSSLPDNAVITKVRLKIMQQGLVGTNPFTTHGPLRGDIRKPFFGAAAGLELGDFQAGAQAGSVLSFGATPSGSWYIGTLGAAGLPYVNKTGTTQFRLRFNLDDNNDKGADYMSFSSGNDATAANRPQLVVQYYVP